MDGDHADLVVGVADHDGLEAAALLDHLGHLVEQGRVGLVQHQGEGLVLGHHHELGEIDGVGALAQDAPLRPLLAALLQKAAGVLEVGVGGIAGERPVGRERQAVAGEDVADAALGNGHQGLQVQAVLERKEEVHAAAQDFRLEAGLAVQGDDAGGDGALAAPQLLHHGGAIVGDVADRPRQDEQDQQASQADHQRPGRPLNYLRHCSLMPRPCAAPVQGDGGAKHMLSLGPDKRPSSASPRVDRSS
jgi:hypothetical protein